MKANTAVILAIIITVIGTWSQGKTLTQKQIAGAIVLLLMFATLNETAPKLAGPFGWLILATIIGTYSDDLFSRIATITGATTPVKKGPVNDVGQSLFATEGGGNLPSGSAGITRRYN